MRRAGLSLFLGGLLLAQGSVASQEPADPFGFLQPTVIVSADERRRLDRGDTVVRVLPAANGEVAIFAAVRVDADGRRLALWVRNIVELKKSAFVRAIARFSEPPRLEDLADLVLDAGDLEAIRVCRPGDCGLKLTASEIETLLRAGRRGSANWRPALQAAFRQVMLTRVQAYLTAGLAGLPPYADRSGAASPQEAFSSIVRSSRFLTARLPEFVDYLERYPRTPAPPRVEGFVYWSKEQLAGKATVNATHVIILESADASAAEVLVAGMQIFATHYLNGSLNVTAIARSPAGHRYMVYVNRSRIDILDRWYGGLARTVIERRVREEASEVLRALRRRLESGEPR